MKFVASTENDISRLTEWIYDDPYHRKHMDPFWWLTGNGLLSYRIEDLVGITMYVRMDRDNNRMRIHTQFAPESEVSKLRVVKSLLWALPKMEIAGKNEQLTGFVFQSTSPDLIKFMKKIGFTPDSGDDYSKLFEENI